MKFRPLLNKPLLSNPDEYNDPPQPFFEHVVALRSCLVRALASWAVCCIVAGVFSPAVLNWLKAPATALEAAGRLKIEGLDLTSGFSAILSIALWGGSALAFPCVMYFILQFVFPALTKREKFAILFYLFAGSFCFGIGVWLAYSKTLPVVVQVFDAINNWVNLPVTVVRIEGYIGIVLRTIIAFGLVFQIPLLLFVLGWLGIVTSDTLRKFRKFAIVIAFFLGMVLTPPDPMSQFLMAFPLVVLYELCIWGVKLKEVVSSPAARDSGQTEGDDAAK